MKLDVLKNMSYGMYIIGACDEKMVGCVANTVVQITNDPITFIVSLNKNNVTTKTILKTKKFSVSILDEETNPEVIGTFGYHTSSEVDKYEKVHYQEVDGLPVLEDSCGYITCEVINTLETTTHLVILGKVLTMDGYKDIKPMTYRFYHEQLKGKSPKTAPTYIPETNTKKTVWKCKVCGYEVEMDELPEDYRCPICGQPMTAFERIEK